jgi:hypothetical protein
MDPVVHLLRLIRALRHGYGRLVEHFRGGRRMEWGSPRLERLGWFVNVAGIVIALGWALALFLPHMEMLSEPGPQEYNEPSIWHVTYLLDHNRNPYSAEELPGCALCFGPAFNYVVLMFKPLFGIGYQAHRLIVAIFLGGSLWLMVRSMLRIGTGLGIALLAAVLYYWMCLGNIMITSRPDAVGLFFFLLCLLIPWEANYARGPTIFGLVCAVLAFHLKSYFILAGCATLLGSFFMRSKKEACWMGVAYFVTIGLTFGVLWAIYPFYYLETVVEQREAAILNSSDAISQLHTGLFFDRGWPFLIAMLFALGAWVWGREQERKAATTSAPNAEKRNADQRFQILWVVFLIFLALVYFYMGRNAGAYFTYHIHLLFPLMFVLAAYATTRPWARIGFGLLLAIFVLFRLEIPQMPDSAGPYRRMEQLILNCHGDVLGLPCQTDILERCGRRVIHNGSTMFLGFALANGRAGWDPLAAIIDQKYNGMYQEVEGKVAARAYELVFTEFDAPMFCNPELLKKNYDEVEQLDYYTYFGHAPVRVWHPKPRGSGEVPKL